MCMTEAELCFPWHHSGSFVPPAPRWGLVERALYLFIKDWEKNRWFKYAFFLPLTAICVTLWSVDSLAITDTVEVEEIWVVFSLTIQINLLSSSDSDNRSDSQLRPQRLPCSEWEYGHIWYIWHRRRLKIRCWCINYDYMCAFLWLGSPQANALQIRPCSHVCMFKQEYGFHFRLDLLQIQLSMLLTLLHCVSFWAEKRKEKPSTSPRSKPRHKCPFHSHFPSRENKKACR